ncbi:MAG TPA: hypothetical protein PKC24_11520 [Cyclobacteriaceae bacterium]|nr:hypothetical protein [Cyclobacteriaceae bacterium]
MKEKKQKKKTDEERAKELNSLSLEELKKMSHQQVSKIMAESFVLNLRLSAKHDSKLIKLDQKKK